MLALLLLTADAGGQQLAPMILEVQEGDYPVDALAAKIEGDVPISLHLGLAGAISCAVREKTVNPMLGRPSCALVVQRWPFGPDRDKAGKESPTDVALVVRWKLPTQPVNDTTFGGATPIGRERWFTYDDYPLDAIRQHQEGRVKVTFDIKPSGVPEHCVVQSSSSSKELDSVACKLVMTRALFLPAIDAQGGLRTANARLGFVFVLPR